MKLKPSPQMPTHHPIDQSRSPTGEAMGMERYDPTPPADLVATSAYYLWMDQGSCCGHDLDHWLEAEGRLLEQRNPQPGPFISV